MDLALLAAPILIPTLGYISGYMLGGRKTWAGVTGAFAFGLLGGAFIGSAAGAMSPTADGYPLLRGATAGAAAGLATGMLIAAVMELRRRRKT
jgi:hypothetical protein